MGKETPRLNPEEVTIELLRLVQYIIENGGDMMNTKGWLLTPNARRLNEIIFGFSITDIVKLGIETHRPGHPVEYLQKKLDGTKISNLNRTGVFSLMHYVKPLLDLKYSTLELDYLLGEGSASVDTVAYDGRQQISIVINEEQWSFAEDCCEQIFAHPEFQIIAEGVERDEYHSPQAKALQRSYETLEDAGRLTVKKALRHIWQTPQTLVDDFSEQVRSISNVT